MTERQAAMARHPAGKRETAYYQEEVVYYDCLDPECPAHRVGYKHAHREGTSNAGAPESSNK